MAGEAAWQLLRLRTWRMVPAALGFAIGSAPAICYNAAIDVLPVGDPALRALGRATQHGYLMTLLALVGYVIGVVAAEVTRRRPIEGVGGALLDARRPSGYLTVVARYLPAGLATWVVTASVAGAVVGRNDEWPRSLLAAVLAAGVAGVQRWIVERPQRLTDADAVALDDSLRSGAAHALAGAASAALLAWALTATQQALSVDDPAPGVVGVAIGLLGVVGVYGLWANYGSAHRARRPQRVEAADSR